MMLTLHHRLLTGLIFYCFLIIQAQADERPVWQQIRHQDSGYSAVSGQETNVLIQTSGLHWLTVRDGLIAGTGAWGLAITVFLLGSFYLVRGQVKLRQPRSGEMIVRWSCGERWLHFVTASIFLLLALTGLSLLYGRSVLIPWIGHDDFSVYAQWAKILHNYLGPLFIAGLLMMILTWFTDNLPSKVDFAWFMQFGGLIGKKHPSAGRMNGGEKAWFWLLLLAGFGVSLSGLLLDFPNFGQWREYQQYSDILHTVSAFLLMIGALGHIYIGTLGTEGALEGMITGKVDASWARQHHDLWYQKNKHASHQTPKKVEKTANPTDKSTSTHVTSQ